MNTFFLMMALFLLSCSTVKLQEKQLVGEEAWKGRPIKEVETHPYFQYLKVKKIKHLDGSQTVIYRDQSKFQSAAYCDSLGGCMGMPIYNCDSAFLVKNGTIEELKQNGVCPGPKTWEPKK